LCVVEFKCCIVIETCKYAVTLKPGLGVTQGHRKNTIQSGTDDFLLTFHSNPSAYLASFPR